MSKYKLIYLCGHSRGGTTWLGEKIYKNFDVDYIFEPFASQAHPYTGYDTQSLFNNRRFYRKNKKGKLLLENISESFFNFEFSDSRYNDFEDIAIDHLHKLVEIYSICKNRDTLLIKQPRIENLGWASRVLAPKFIVVLDRHPFGVVNSYVKGGFWNWVEPEWEIARSSIPVRFPDYTNLIKGARSLAEKLLVLSYIRSDVISDFVSNRENCFFVTYEDLCFDTENKIKKIATKLNLLPRQQELGCNVTEGQVGENHYMSTVKDSKMRAWAWRYELPPKMLKELVVFVDRYDLNIQVPGNGLDHVSLDEKLKGMKIRGLREFSNKKRLFKNMILNG